MTVCNMSIEAGARAGMIAPDETTFAYLKGRPHAPHGRRLGRRGRVLALAAHRRRRGLRPRGRHRRGRADAVRHLGHQPRPGRCRCRRRVPDPATFADAGRARRGRARAGVHGPDRRHAAARHRGRHRLPRLLHQRPDRGPAGRRRRARAAAQVADGVRMLVVPGSVQVRLQAEAEGLDEVFKAAGAEWREAGCSMCLGMNPDQLAPGERSASTSNRNFEGRQGKGGRTHLVSPGRRRRHRRRRPPRRARRPVPQEHEAAADGGLHHPHRHRACRCGAATSTPTRSSRPSTSSGSRRTGFEDGLFAAWRQDPDFVLNQPEYAGASILVAGPDFGTGSSREHAVWALQNYGFRVVISLAVRRHLPRQLRKVGLLTVERRAGRRRAAVDGDRGGPGDRGHRRPEAREVARPGGDVASFEIDDYTRWRLLEGLDDIGLTLRHADAVAGFARDAANLHARTGITESAKWSEPTA